LVVLGTFAGRFLWLRAAARTSAAPANWLDLHAPDDWRRGVEKATWELDADATIAFALSLIMLFGPQLDTAGAALFTLMATGYTAARIKQLPAMFAPRAFLLAIAVLAFVSSLWSEQPIMTLKYSLELALTMVASLILSATPRPKRVIEAIFLACAVHAVVSLGFGQTVAMGANGDTAFAGLNDSKNMLADSAGAGFLAAMGVFFIGIEEGRYLRCATAVFVAAVELYTILLARSAGGIVGVAIAAAALLFFVSFRKAAFAVRATVLGVLGFCFGLVALAYEALSDVAADIATRYFDKDPTFTGRAYLWQRAGDLITEKPLLGRGFHAFWYDGNQDANGLWQFIGIKSVNSVSGANFHNTFIELLVHLGWVGLIVFTLTLLVAVALLVFRFVRYPDIAVCFWLSVAVYECARMPIETMVPGEFAFSTVLLWIGFGSALKRTPARILAARPRTPVQPSIARSGHVPAAPTGGANLEAASRANAIPAGADRCDPQCG
jgi:exopolysaccharide production protein ExoQ